jgi:ribonuclease HI
MEQETVRIWTDGACIGNPGPGGWAWVKSFRSQTVSKSGHIAALTTNIAMEMIAVIQALRSLKRMDLPVLVHTDLKMIVLGMNEWLPKWVANGWRNGKKEPVANRSLWEALAALRDARLPGAEITFVWVKAHAGLPQNEAADRLAEGEARTAARMAGVSPPMPTRFDAASGLAVPLFDLEAA